MVGGWMAGLNGIKPSSDSNLAGTELGNNITAKFVCGLLPLFSTEMI